MEYLPPTLEQKIENLPIVSFDNTEQLYNIIWSQEFTDIFTFYKQNYLPDLLKSKPEIYQRISLYLVLTNQNEDFVKQTTEILYRRPCPDIHTFLTNNFYHGRLSATLYPYWKDKLEYIFKEGSPIRQVIYQGCVGSGKSTVARKAMVYMLYKILCLKYPRAIYNIDNDSTIAAFIISVNLKQVYETNLLPFVKLLENMPCFQRVLNLRSFENFDLDNPKCPIPFVLEKSTATIFFPNNIILTSGSQINHTVGYNIPLCFCLSGNTQIETEVGIKTISDLVKDFESKNTNFVYAVDENKNIIKTKIINAKQTNLTKELIKIWLNDKDYIECTPNHKFLIKNPNKEDSYIIYSHGLPYKEAQYLTENDELAEF